MKNNQKNGKGIYYLAQRDRYEGEFKDDYINEKGIYYEANGKIFEDEDKDNIEGNTVQRDKQGDEKEEKIDSTEENNGVTTRQQDN